LTEFHDKFTIQLSNSVAGQHFMAILLKDGTGLYFFQLLLNYFSKHFVDNMIIDKISIMIRCIIKAKIKNLGCAE
jgi:hypothetical protein